MPFAPHEIEEKKFVVALRGYQTDEVDAFLRAVAADYRALLERVEVEADPPPDEAKAAEILRAAELEASEILAAANAEAEGVYAEIARQAEELRRAEARLSEQLLALERTVREGKQVIGGLNALVQ